MTPTSPFIKRAFSTHANFQISKTDNNWLFNTPRNSIVYTRHRKNITYPKPISPASKWIIFHRLNYYGIVSVKHLSKKFICDIKDGMNSVPCSDCFLRERQCVHWVDYLKIYGLTKGQSSSKLWKASPPGKIIYQHRKGKTKSKTKKLKAHSTAAKLNIR
jgi:hypothetical protein